jgi:hypothetical protein
MDHPPAPHNFSALQEIPPRDQQAPEALAVFQKAEAETWWPLTTAANIKGE